MKQWIKTSILSAAVAAVPFFFSRTAHAQQRINTDGQRSTPVTV